MIRKLILSIFAFVVLAIGFSSAAPVQAASWNPFDSACSSASSNADNPGNSDICKDKDNTSDPISGKDGILLKITNLIAIVAGVAATIMLILGGLQFVQSSGSGEDVASARRTIIYAAVGLVVIILARTLIVFVIAGLS